MDAIVWVNIVLAIPFLIAFIAVPLWMTFRTSQAGPDHAEAHAYLASTTAMATARAGRARDAARPAAVAA